MFSEGHVASLDWSAIQDRLLEKGFYVTPPILNEEECGEIRGLFGREELFRSTIDMKRYNFGKGVYRYFKYPLPNKIKNLRSHFYENLVSTANTWAKRAKYDVSYPDRYDEFLRQMKESNQSRSTPLILKYNEGDYTCLHQDIANDLFFPYLVDIAQGAAVIFSSNFHPQLGARGYYRTVFKHGVVEVTRGERYTLGLVFHDYRNKN